MYNQEVEKVAEYYGELVRFELFDLGKFYVEVKVNFLQHPVEVLAQNLTFMRHFPVAVVVLPQE